MHRSRKLMIVGGSILALSAGGAGVAVAVGGDDGDAQATGPAADHAKRVALRITAGGRANAVEHGSENGGVWEVEVTKPDGNTVDVRLDENYDLVVVEGDSEAPDESR
jgi:hypothetical protein